MTESTEARASLNFKGVTAKGWDVQFTLRDDDEGKLMARFGEFVKVLEAAHVTPPGHGTLVQVRSEPVAGVPAEAVPMQPTVPADLGIGHYDGVYDAVSMTCKIEDGKVYWKVKGGEGTQFGKYGVTVWPEVFEAAGLEFDPLKAPYNLAGWKAAYVNNEEGKPKKVIALLK